MKLGAGRTRDNRHFFNLELSDKNYRLMPPSTEKEEIGLIRQELLDCKFNPSDFEIIAISEVKLKYRHYFVYILQDSRTRKGFGSFVYEGVAKCMHVNQYRFTDPYGKNKDFICQDVHEAMFKTGVVKASSFE